MKLSYTSVTVNGCEDIDVLSSGLAIFSSVCNGQLVKALNIVM